MRWCCGGGGGNNDSSPTSSTTANKNNAAVESVSNQQQQQQQKQPSTMMTELSLKSGKNSSKLSKNRNGKGGDSKGKGENSEKKHCVLQQSSNEGQVTQISSETSAPGSGGAEGITRPGVLKSSLKLLQSRNAPKSAKGVQYADEVAMSSATSSSHPATIGHNEVVEEELSAADDGERTKLLRKSLAADSEDDEQMDVSGREASSVVFGLEKENNENVFPYQQQHESFVNNNSNLRENAKKISMDGDAKAEGGDSFSEFHAFSAHSPTSRQLPAPTRHTTASTILKSASPSPAPLSLLAHNNINPLYDTYGPMLVRTCKTALYVTAPPHTAGAMLPPLPPSSSASSTSSSAVPAAPTAQPGTTFLPPIIERLQHAGWTVFVTNRANTASDLQTRRPVLILVDEKVEDFVNFSNALRVLPECEDSLISALFERPPSANISQPHFLLYSGVDISLCELFARLTSRLRAVPALFAVIEEAEQPIKICDENNIAQYVNRAYEIVTGRARSDVLGSDASEMREKTLNNVSTTAATPSLNTWSGSLPPAGTAPSTSVAGKFHPADHHHQPMPNSLAMIAQRHSLPTSCGGIGSPTIMPISHPATVMDTTLSTGSSGTIGAGSTNTIGPPMPYSSANRRRSSEWHCITVPTCSTMSPQFVYVKRGSTDAIGRELSLKSLRSQSALVEAPITEALNVLDTVLHRCAEDEAMQMQVRDAIKILSSAELYAPTITRFRDNDRIASGYYDGLIRLHHPSRQRKRSVVDAFRENQQRRVSAGSSASSTSTVGGMTGAGAVTEFGATAGGRRISADVVNALENESSWNFDVIELERITEHRPLSQLGIKIFERWDVTTTLKCSTDIVARWLQVIEANYQSGNAYHNATHAADVLQATSFFLNSDAVGQFVQDQHAISALIAATVHDLDHPGRGNAFLMNTRSRLAVLYNDHSVLENHHVALAFQLTLTQPGVNIFARVHADEFSQIRQATIDMVLATDMSRHFEYLTKFQQLLGILPTDIEENRDANSLTICRMMIKCADIANPTREWKLCYQWAMRIVVEYFDQTAEETEKCLPLTMKGFDCKTCNIPLTQCTFADMFAREAFTSWCDFAELPHLLVQLEANYERWKAQAADWDPKQNANVLQRRQGGVGRS